MTMLKKSVSAILVGCTVLVSAGASNIGASTIAPSHDMPHTLTIKIGNEPVELQYHVANGVVDKVAVGNEVFTRKGNDVFRNGEKIATITSTTDFASSDIEPYTSWIYGNNKCPSGYSPSDYNQLYGTKWHNVTFEKAIAECAVSTILGVLILMVDFENPTIGQQVLQKIAENILNVFASYSGKNAVYAYERIYAGGMPYTRKNIFEYYGDKNKNNYAGTATCYSSWA